MFEWISETPTEVGRYNYRASPDSPVQDILVEIAADEVFIIRLAAWPRLCRDLAGFHGQWQKVPTSEHLDVLCDLLRAVDGVCAADTLTLSDALVELASENIQLGLI